MAWRSSGELRQTNSTGDSTSLKKILLKSLVVSSMRFFARITLQPLKFDSELFSIEALKFSQGVFLIYKPLVS
jgi:hypothetical protein